VKPPSRASHNVLGAKIPHRPRELHFVARNLALVFNPHVLVADVGRLDKGNVVPAQFPLRQVHVRFHAVPVAVRLAGDVRTVRLQLIRVFHLAAAGLEFRLPIAGHIGRAQRTRQPKPQRQNRKCLHSFSFQPLRIVRVAATKTGRASTGLRMRDSFAAVPLLSTKTIPGRFARERGNRGAPLEDMQIA